MPSVGTFYSPAVNFRAYKARIVAEVLGLELNCPEFTNEDRTKPEFLAKFPVGKTPGFETPEGQTLTDSNAIAYYLAGLKPGNSLLGKDNLEAAQILQFILYSESEVLPPLLNWFATVLGFVPYMKPTITKAKQDATRFLTALDNILLDRTYLVGERMTLADIVMACNLLVPMKLVLDPAFRAPFKNVVRYFRTIVNQPAVAKIVGTVNLCEKEATFAAPKKEEKKPKKETKPKAEPKPKAAPAPAAEEEEPKPEPKPKSKLDLLPPSSFNMEDWKRFYSNHDTKPDAMDYFWKHYDPQGYSIWRVCFKYNPELTMTFMSTNQIGGFFARLERARKYAFGSLLVLGTNNDNEIRGYFVIRGDEVPFEIYDAPDYESYEFTKVDPTDEKIKEEIGDYFAWEGPTLPKPCADGKVFK